MKNPKRVVLLLLFGGLMVKRDYRNKGSADIRKGGGPGRVLRGCDGAMLLRPVPLHLGRGSRRGFSHT